MPQAAMRKPRASSAFPSSGRWSRSTSSRAYPAPLRASSSRRCSAPPGPDVAGVPKLLTIIAAIILGGTSLRAAAAACGGTLLAVLILGTLANGMTLLNVSSFWQDVTRGVVLLLAVGLDQARTRALGD